MYLHTLYLQPKNKRYNRIVTLQNEYYNMIADKIVAIDKELEVHKRRNFASPKKPGQETEVKGANLS